MGAFVAVFYWNTTEKTLPTSHSSNVVPVTVPCQELNELVICDLIEEEEVQPVNTYTQFKLS